MADIVLPATTFLEHDDIYTASGHTHLQLARKIVEPQGEARTNHYVICELAKRLGAKHPGFEMTEWQIIEKTLAMSGLPGPDGFDGGRWLDLAVPFETAHFLDGFGHPDKKFHFKPNWKALGTVPRGLARAARSLRDHRRGDGGASLPHGCRARRARSSTRASTTRPPASPAKAGRAFSSIPTILPRPAPPRATASASATARAASSSTPRRSTAFSAASSSSRGSGRTTPSRKGIGINTLTSAEPGRPAGGAVFHDTAVWLRKAPAQGLSARASIEGERAGKGKQRAAAEAVEP